MEDAEPQAILTPITEAAILLTLIVDEGGEDAVRDALSDVSGLKRSVGFRLPEGNLTCVVGVGADAWDRLFGVPRPAGLHPFRALARPEASRAGHTRRSLLPYPRPQVRSLLRARAAAHRAPRRPRNVVDEVHGFRSFDERDLLGFVDGTENPEGAAATAAVLIDADGDRDVRGRELCRRAEVRARPHRVGRAARRATGASNRPDEAERHRDAR